MYFYRLGKRERYPLREKERQISAEKETQQPAKSLVTLHRWSLDIGRGTRKNFFHGKEARNSVSRGLTRRVVVLIIISSFRRPFVFFRVRIHLFHFYATVKIEDLCYFCSCNDLIACFDRMTLFQLMPH